MDLRIPGFPDLRTIADRSLLAVANDRRKQHLRRFEKHVEFIRIIGQMLKNRIVHILRIDQRIETDGVFYTRQLTFADPVTNQVNILILDPSLLEPSFGFFGVKRFVLSQI